jgi:hypothetical protein
VAARLHPEVLNSDPWKASVPAVDISHSTVWPVLPFFQMKSVVPLPSKSSLARSV